MHNEDTMREGRSVPKTEQCKRSMRMADQTFVAVRPCLPMLAGVAIPAVLVQIVRGPRAWEVINPHDIGSSPRLRRGCWGRWVRSFLLRLPRSCLLRCMRLKSKSFQWQPAESAAMKTILAIPFSYVTLPKNSCLISLPAPDSQLPPSSDAKKPIHSVVMSINSSRSEPPWTVSARIWPTPGAKYLFSTMPGSSGDQSLVFRQ